MIIINIAVTLLLISLITYYYNEQLFKEKSKISIKESLDLLEIPVITLENNNKKFNFILDSGSSNSHISPTASKDILYNKKGTINYSANSANGTITNKSKVLNVDLMYKKDIFNINLIVTENLELSFKDIMDDNKIQLHGIIGSDFLIKHKYILDFADKVAYHK